MFMLLLKQMKNQFKSNSKLSLSFLTNSFCRYLERVSTSNWPRFLRTNNGFNAFPPDVCKFGQSLCEIDMSYNQIPYVPPEISLIKNLSKLVLNNNSIKFLPIEVSPISSFLHLISDWIFNQSSSFGTRQKCTHRSPRYNCKSTSSSSSST